MREQTLKEMLEENLKNARMEVQFESCCDSPVNKDLVFAMNSWVRTLGKLLDKVEREARDKSCPTCPEVNPKVNPQVEAFKKKVDDLISKIERSGDKGPCGVGPCDTGGDTGPYIQVPLDDCEVSFTFRLSNFENAVCIGSESIRAWAAGQTEFPPASPEVWMKVLKMIVLDWWFDQVRSSYPIATHFSVSPTKLWNRAHPRGK